MNDRVMLLIDADNVSVDVIEQAVAHLLGEHGALHVRRAYCTAEGALKHQSVFRRLSIKPMVNLSTGKNSTDIALAVDAIDLVLAERPDVVAIASSDSDFAPLVARLREKGCRVVGIGQDGKTGDETLQIYDAFKVMTHRSGSRSAPATAAKRASSTGAAKRPARKTAGGRSAAAPATTASPPAAVTASRSAPSVAAPAPVPASTPAAEAPPTKTAAKSPARKTVTRRSSTGRKTAAPAAEAASAAPAPAAAEPRAAEPRAPEPDASPRRATTEPEAPDGDRMARLLAVLPELERGGTLELRVASQRLRDAGLLTRSGSSTRLFGQFADRFELLPPGNPNHVRLQTTAADD